jgi:hypothetical protein
MIHPITRSTQSKYRSLLRGIDVVVKLFGTDGRQITEFASERRPKGQETVSWVAEEAGSHRLDVLVKYVAGLG